LRANRTHPHLPCTIEELTLSTTEQSDLHAYCDCCEAIRPAQIDWPWPHDSGRFEGADITCKACHCIIACLYRPLKGFGPAEPKAR